MTFTRRTENATVTQCHTGTSRSAEGKIVGDIDDAAREVASWIAPMPGGIGPMTRAMLLSNVVEAAEAVTHSSRYRMFTVP